MAESFEAGWLLAGYERRGGDTVLLQGHPEYHMYDLHKEYVRDQDEGQAVPENYYPNDDPNRTPSYKWHDDSSRLFANAVAMLKA